MSGAVYLYDRSTTKNYKDDGHLWIKKRNSHKVREDHVKLRMDGVNRISGCYVHSSANEFMHRRAYHLIPNEEEEGKLARARMQLAGENGVPMNADTAAPKNKNGVIKRGVLGKEQRTSD